MSRDIRDAHHALELLDDVDSLVRFCSVTMPDVERYNRGSWAFWSVVHWIAARHRTAPDAEPVAWIYERDGRRHVSPTRVTSSRDAFYGWTETPLYTHPDASVEAVLADICSERVLLACSAAKAVPGDVFVKGAEGHYAFLCGLAALLNLPITDLSLAHGIGVQREWMTDDHTMRCPDRVLSAMGFRAALAAMGERSNA